MFEVSFEKTANLLTISFIGRIDADEAKQGADKVQSLLSLLPPGFSMLSDLRALESMDLGCMPHIEKVMDWCDCAGIKKVVRIIPDPRKDIGLNIMSLFHYRPGVRIVTCQTLEQAVAALAR